MRMQTGQSPPADDGWLPQIFRLPKTMLLTTARAAGRATRISQNSASTLARGMVQATTWSKDRVVGSAKWLNPFRRAKRSPNKPQPNDGTGTGVRVAASPPVVKIHHVQVPSAPPAPPVRPSGVGVSGVQKANEPKPRPKPRPVESPRSRLGTPQGDTLPPEVTLADASAAVFATVSEKVIFARSLKELADQNEATRARAAAALGSIPHELSVRALAARLARDLAVEVRKECVNALTALERSDGLPAVERALSDRSSMVRLAAVRGVYRLASPAGASSLVRLLSDDDEGVRHRAAMCIGWLGRAELADELRPLLHETSVWVRLAALEALQNLKSPAALEDVIALLSDPEESVRRQAFEALRIITGKQMSATFPEDERGRQFLIARWRAWCEANRPHSRPRSR